MSGLDDILGRLPDARRSGSGWQARCRAHDDRQASLSIAAGTKRRVIVKCHAGCDAEAIVIALGLDPSAILGAGGDERRNGATHREIVATYDYSDERGALLFQCVRFRPKGFSQRRPNGSGGWVWNLQGVRRVLYRLPELIDAPRDAVIYLVEGEKDVDRLRALGLVATTSAMGAGKWRPEYAESLRGRHVVVLPDNDESGRNHAADVVTSLTGKAAAVATLELPGLPPKGDVSDWLDAGRSIEDLVQLAEAALADVADVADVADSRADAEKIDGAAILDDLHAFTGRFVAYPSPHAHTAHTLWIAHTHLMGAWDSTPRIAFLSPEPGSGKTRALEVSELLAPRPVEAINVTPAYLFRKVGDPAGLPTILYDEIDTVFGPKAKENEEIRGLLNAGHRRGAVAGRCVVKGKLVETEEIPAYSAVALAGLGGLPDTILSRSIVVRMRRRAPGERVEPFRRRVHELEGHTLRDRLAAWARTVQDVAASAWPTLPDGIVDRDADLWEPLLAVADLAGGEWPERARCGAVALVAESKRSTPSLGVRLLTDLWTVFEGHDVLSTDAILVALNGLDEAPWGEIANGKPLNARGLARRLHQYGVSSKTVRIGSITPKGYAAEDFADAWARYVPVSRHRSATSATDDDSPSGQRVADDVADEPDVADSSATDDDVELCATCGVNAVEMPGLDCDECIGA